MSMGFRCTMVQRNHYRMKLLSDRVRPPDFLCPSLELPPAGFSCLIDNIAATLPDIFSLTYKVYLIFSETLTHSTWSRAREEMRRLVAKYPNGIADFHEKPATTQAAQLWQWNRCL
jgi:hypothetical protein